MVEKLGMDIHESKKKDPVIFCTWFRELLKRFMDWEPDLVRASMSQRYETKYVKNTPVCNLLQCCDERLYEDEHEPNDEKEEYLLTPEVGVLDVQKELIHGVLENKLKDAKKRGAEDESIERLRKFFLKDEDVFRVEFAADPLVKVEPLKLPLDEGSRDYFTVVTPSGLFTATRVIMGSTDAVAYAQQVTEQVMKPDLGNGVQETRKAQEEDLKKHNHYNFIKDEESLLWVDGHMLDQQGIGVFDNFVDKCLHCLGANGEKCPRPYGETLRATKPNEILHFDFLSMPKGLHGFCYVLVLKDGMSGFCEFVSTTMTNTAVTVPALLDWSKRYGVVLLWVSDQDFHFKNTVMDNLRKILGAQHHFVTAYCPWANGTVEVMNRQLLKVMRSLLSEKKQWIGNWPSLLSLC
uniref:AlNc14C568G12167 protein n=1 Tax=Albugo laibachii Nc14 TaxID=890382 RepID=F0X173_9STRA|nr:AlNc14C568G12167 [Albugo laibachii Nc14]|eukprot:CCA27531.1 AlNc14C568G12167 [Albugo laibachii Nc14]